MYDFWLIGMEMCSLKNENNKELGMMVDCGLRIEILMMWNCKYEFNIGVFFCF